eukprot:CAMPEP_0174744144 /NCGR_PEP_ID=MMETSP1094-20130205/83458_1 /TAXON_ID=156173 /ORGANISM="Chrysochromulina brevifilum, Strain UTEX LB 985" /LENGTH=49 /DNA_ID=CAMNT_0015948463 /DNA_START=181 /DNA_END=330 /DNA_ORIENTATION=+
MEGLSRDECVYELHVIMIWLHKAEPRRAAALRTQTRGRMAVQMLLIVRG